jgi:hypothetical protein
MIADMDFDDRRQHYFQPKTDSDACLFCGCGTGGHLGGDLPDDEVDLSRFPEAYAEAIDDFGLDG